MLLISLEEIFSWTPIPGFDDLTVARLLIDVSLILFVFIVARFAVRLIRRLVYQKTNLDEHKKNAIIQISKYLIYLLAISVTLDKLHIGSIIFTSFAGLFVGLGFGLQQTFNDLISGFILMFEGSVKVGDIIKMDTQVGRVVKIGDRYSIIRTRNDVTIMVPNSKLIVDQVTNLSGQTSYTRFGISVGVMYGSDVDLVKEMLLLATSSHPEVLIELPASLLSNSNTDIEPPRVYFKDFGDNSLLFEVFFWTQNVWDIEIVQSDIRFHIHRIFNEQGIVIAFPQRDVHIKLGDKELEKLKTLR
ncbi:MAG: mechanosensitive ion channel [Microscillaceae bacterium]|nr:mechanosensitive ion channel [Microscillaceae bacterium]